MPLSGHLYNIFSNLWFYIGTGDNITDIGNITKIKQIHGVTKCLNLDDKTGFWSSTISKLDQYDPSISAQLQIRNSSQLLDSFKALTHMITTLLTKPSGIDKNKLCKDHIMLIYTSNTENTECLLGLYIYILCKTTGMDMTSATEILKSKIQINTPGVDNAIVRFSDYMKKFLYLNCNQNNK